MAWTTNPEVVCTELEEGAVLVNMDTRLYYGLDPVGLEIFHLADGAGDVEAIARAVEARFELDGERALRAVEAFVEQLEEESLLVPGDRDGAGQPAGREAPKGDRRPFSEPELVRHDEPLHEVAISPFDPQLPLAE